MRTTTDPISMVQEIQAELPCRDSLQVIEEPAAGARPSKSRRDRAPEEGTPMSHPNGWGIAVDGRKEQRGYREWWIACTIRPPETDEERRKVAAAMARRWDRITADRLAPAPSDHRDIGKVRAQRDAHSRLRERLVSAGLLEG